MCIFYRDACLIDKRGKYTEKKENDSKETIGRWFPNVNTFKGTS